MAIIETVGMYITDITKTVPSYVQTKLGRVDEEYIGTPTVEEDGPNLRCPWLIVVCSRSCFSNIAFHVKQLIVIKYGNFPLRKLAAAESRYAPFAKSDKNNLTNEFPTIGLKSNPKDF